MCADSDHQLEHDRKLVETGHARDTNLHLLLSSLAPKLLSAGDIALVFDHTYRLDTNKARPPECEDEPAPIPRA